MKIDNLEMVMAYEGTLVWKARILAKEIYSKEVFEKLEKLAEQVDEDYTPVVPLGYVKGWLLENKKLASKNKTRSNVQKLIGKYKIKMKINALSAVYLLKTQDEQALVNKAVYPVSKISKEFSARISHLVLQLKRHTPSLEEAIFIEKKLQQQPSSQVAFMAKVANSHTL